MFGKRIERVKDSLSLLKNKPLSASLRILKLSRTPIVIGGCGRSGTTFLLSVLSCHPNIFAIDIETKALCPTAYGKKPDLSASLKMALIFNYLYECKDEIPKSCTRWCEKTPKNVLFFGRILDYFGQRVKIIHIVRDGRDVITSIHPEDPSAFWITPERWIEDVSCGLKYENHPQVLTIRYEDLVRNYEKILRKICLFIEEEFTDTFLAYPETAYKNKSSGWGGPAKAPDEKSIGRWKEDQHSEIIERFMANPKAIDLLRHFGYL